MITPPRAYFSKSIASGGRPQTMRLRLPDAPHPGHAAVFTEIFFEFITILSTVKRLDGCSDIGFVQRIEKSSLSDQSPESVQNPFHFPKCQTK